MDIVLKKVDSAPSPNPTLLEVPRVYQRATYSFEVPDAAVAQEPLPRRDAAKLAVRFNSGKTVFSHFAQLKEFIPRGSLIIRNQTQVIPARFFGMKSTGANLEVFLLESCESTATSCTWTAIGRPLKKFTMGSVINFVDGLEATVVAIPPTSVDQVLPVTLSFNRSKSDLIVWLNEYAKMPLPPYIKRERADDSRDTSDKARYQTVYGRDLGSVAAPTAGLHFSEQIFSELRSRGVNIADVTLHVGAGTFLPIKCDDIRDHHMHTERYLVPKTTVEQIISAKQQRRPIIAIGTTSFRCLESFMYACDNDLTKMIDHCEQWQSTDLFIHPKEDRVRYHPQVADAIMTNFHQPESSLFILISALIGIDEAKHLYHQALEQHFRFFSYGDTSLLWFNDNSAVAPP